MSAAVWTDLAHDAGPWAPGGRILRPVRSGGWLTELADRARSVGQFLTVVQTAVLFANRYRRLEMAAIAAARAYDAMLIYVPRNLSGVYQDSAGTTPAVLGSVIGGIADKQYGLANTMAGAGYHVSQTTTANKPILVRLANGYYGFSFDGVNDKIIGRNPNSPSFEIFISTQILRPAVGHRRIFGRLQIANNTGACVYRIGTTSKLTNAYGSGSYTYSIDSGYTVTDNVGFTVESSFSTTGFVTKINGTAGTGATVDIVLADSAQSVTIGNINNTDTVDYMLGTGVLFCHSISNMPDNAKSAIARFGAFLAGASYA